MNEFYISVYIIILRRTPARPPRRPILSARRGAISCTLCAAISAAAYLSSCPRPGTDGAGVCRTLNECFVYTRRRYNIKGYAGRCLGGGGEREGGGRLLVFSAVSSRPPLPPPTRIQSAEKSKRKNRARMIKRDIIISKRRLTCLSPTRRLKLLSSAARVFLAVRTNPFSCLRSYSRDTVSDEVFRRAFSPDINSVYSAFSFRLSPDHVSLQI